MITLKDYLMGREVAYPISDDLLFNANEVVARVNLVLIRFGDWRRVVSGYRPAAINAATPGAAAKSRHMTCEAADLEDVNRKFSEWCMKNQDVLKEYGLWMESPLDTPTWVHLQTCPPRSGVRVFRR